MAQAGFSRWFIDFLERNALGLVLVAPLFVYFSVLFAGWTWLIRLWSALLTNWWFVILLPWFLVLEVGPKYEPAEMGGPLVVRSKTSKVAIGVLLVLLVALAFALTTLGVLRHAKNGFNLIEECLSLIQQYHLPAFAISSLLVCNRCFHWFGHRGIHGWVQNLPVTLTGNMF